MAYTVKAGDTLSKLYGSNWQQLSGYTGDPTKLQVGAQLNDLPGQAKQAAATSVSANPVSKPPINIFANTAPYSTGGTPINPATLPNTSGVYNNAQGTGSTRVIGGAGVPSNLPGQPAQTGFLGAVNNFGKTIGGYVDSMFGTNYAGINPTQTAQTNKQPTNNQNPPPQMASSTYQAPAAQNYSPPTDSNAAQKAAIQAQIDALQGRITSATNAGYTAGNNQQIQYDANGNIMPANGGTDAQGNVIQNMANTTNPTTYQQVVNSLANFQNPQYTTAYQNLQNIQNEAASAQAGTENVAGGAPITASDQAGQSGILSRLYEAKIANAQTAVTNALTAGGQQLTGLEYAQGSLQPQLGNYGQTYYNPLSAFGGTQGGQGGQGLDPQTQASQLASLVASGQLDYATASSQMSYAGQQGTSLLRNAILAQNPQFNFNLSTSSAGTQQQGQQIRTGQVSANQALDSLQVAFNGLSGLTSTSIPFINQLTQGLSMQTGIGRQQTSAFLGALNEARSQVSAILSSLIGVNQAGTMSYTLLPDNMIPSEVPAKIAAAKQYIQQRVNAYTQSGNQQGGTSSNTSGGLYNF